MISKFRFNKKKMKFPLIFGVIIIVFLVTYPLLAYSKEIGLVSNLNQNTADEEKIQTLVYSSCYVASTDYSSYETDLSYQNLTNGNTEIFTSEDNFEFLKEQGITDTSSESLFSGGVMIVPFDQVDFTMKVLTVDGVSIWNKDTISDYKLCFKNSFTGTDQEITEVKQDLWEYEDNYYDFDIESVQSIFAGGEIIPARAVDRTWLNQSDNYTLLFDRLADRIRNSDLSIAMLENPISGNPEPCRGCMMFVGDERNAAGFKEVGFDAFGIGNHFGDGGEQAIARTIEVFKEQEIKLAGASVTSLEEASAPVIMQMGERKVALFSAEDVAAYYWFGQDFGTNYYSTKSSSGGIGGINADKIHKDISAVKDQVDYVIVMMSWGIEYTNQSSSHQKELAHALIDAGADVIIGSHPHWVQEIEIYKDKPIFYSLGNFIFDQTGEGASADSSRKYGETRQGVTIELYLYQGNLVSFDIVPHKMCGYEQAGGEGYNKTHNLAWKIQEGQMTYDEVDEIPESQGCVWYQPTVQNSGSEIYKAVWDRMMEYSSI